MHRRWIEAAGGECSECAAEGGAAAEAGGGGVGGGGGGEEGAGQGRAAGVVEVAPAVSYGGEGLEALVKGRTIAAGCALEEDAAPGGGGGGGKGGGGGGGGGGRGRGSSKRAASSRPPSARPLTRSRTGR